MKWSEPKLVWSDSRDYIHMLWLLLSLGSHRPSRTTKLNLCTLNSTSTPNYPSTCLPAGAVVFISRNGTVTAAEYTGSVWWPSNGTEN